MRLPRLLEGDARRVRLLRELSRDILDELHTIVGAGIRPKLLTFRAGVSPRTAFYTVLETREAALRMVADICFDPARSDRTIVLKEEMSSKFPMVATDQAGWIAELCEAYFKDVLEHRQSELQIKLWSIGSADDYMRSQHAGLYDHLIRTTSALFDDLLVAMEREVAPPFTTVDMAAIMMAVSDGLVIQTAGTDAENSTVAARRFASTILALAPSLTRPVGVGDEYHGRDRNYRSTLEEVWSEFEG